METKDQIAAQIKGKIATSIEPYAGFTLAEDYHQKHSLRSYPEVIRELGATDTKGLINSTIAARLNGYVGGYGSCDTLKKEIEGSGLSQSAKETVISSACGRKASIACPIR